MILAPLSTFTIEQNEAIYFTGGFNCSGTPTTTITGLQSTSLDGSGTISLHAGIPNVPIMESFTRNVIFATGTDNQYRVISTESVTSCPGTGFALSSFTATGVVEHLRMYRITQQPLPSKFSLCTDLFVL